jgi:hypothetical protein
MMNPDQDRVRELEAENARLKAEVDRATAEGQTLYNALRLLAPEYVVTEAEMRAVMSDPVPFVLAVEEAERAAGITHAP